MNDQLPSHAPWPEANACDTPDVPVPVVISSDGWTRARPALMTLNVLQTIFLGGIFVFCLLAACYVMANILLPFFLALLMKFVLHPLVRMSQRWHVPPTIMSVALIGSLFVVLFGIGSAISEPVGKWSARAQDAIPHLQEQFGFIRDRVQNVQQALSKAENISPSAGDKTLVVSVKGTTFADRLLAGTGHLVSGIIETVVILLFLLISGDMFLRRLVEVLPRFKDKKHAVAISLQIENDLSGYLLTITLINMALGIATGIAMRLCGVEDALLWGTLAYALNYVPFLGPIIMTGILVLVGAMLPHPDGAYLLPAMIYFGLHLLESQMLTPMLLARRFILNPVMIILSLTFWFWMWGIIGAILATPMLAVLKIICDKIDVLRPFGHLIEGDAARQQPETL